MKPAAPDDETGGRPEGQTDRTSPGATGARPGPPAAGVKWPGGDVRAGRRGSAARRCFWGGQSSCASAARLGIL